MDNVMGNLALDSPHPYWHKWCTEKTRTLFTSHTHIMFAFYQHGDDA